jgi:cytochrome c-type biogenesis protein CcmH/NrfG
LLTDGSVWQVLEGLVTEDDSVPDVWYLLGLAFHAGGDFEDALRAAEEAERLVTLRRHEDPGAGELLIDLEELKVSARKQIISFRYDGA